jgi:hypothetical protein
VIEEGATRGTIHETEKVLSVFEERGNKGEGVEVLDGVAETKGRFELTIRGEKRLWVTCVVETDEVGET